MDYPPSFGDPNSHQ
ncbi:unnamed protein product, partial [Rotaria magnacalcarata]